jgi:hypothetical protein
MKSIIYDLEQFFKFCEIQKFLSSVAEQNHQTIYDDINKIINQRKKIITNSLKIKSEFSLFFKKNNFKIIDLDLLQIALFENINTITPQIYLEKSILVNYDKTIIFKIINQINKSSLIKKNYLKFENPFIEESINENKKLKNIINLLNTPFARKKSKKKFIIEDETKAYNNINLFLNDLNILDKIINLNIDNEIGISKSNIDYLYNFYLNQNEPPHRRAVGYQLR